MADRRSDPYKNFRFRIKWDGRHVAGVSKVSALKRTTEVVEHRDGGDSRSLKVPGRMEYEPITLERGITRDRGFEQWANALIGPPPGSPPLVDFRKDIVIELYNERGQLALAYTVHGCWVSEYQALPDLDANGHQIAIEHITLQNEGWERDTSVVEPAEVVLGEVVTLDASLRIAGLARRAATTATWDDLVLPPAPMASLKQIASHLRQRSTVLRDWGFGRASTDAGVAALFTGAPGTGKTLAAEVIAHDLDLELFRVDVASVVSHHIGETEKHLEQVFDAAQGTGAILLFDEADALFGKRTDVQDSHDRHANIDVAHLLARIDAYDGLAVLASDLRAEIDDRVRRRFRFVVEFPFPDASAREAIWRNVFPAAAPTERLDYRELAQLKLTGGAIRRAARDAAFLAAAAGGSVSMAHVLEAASISAAGG